MAMYTFNLPRWNCSSTICRFVRDMAYCFTWSCESVSWSIVSSLCAVTRFNCSCRDSTCMLAWWLQVKHKYLVIFISDFYYLLLHTCIVKTFGEAPLYSVQSQLGLGQVMFLVFVTDNKKQQLLRRQTITWHFPLQLMKTEAFPPNCRLSFLALIPDPQRL